MNRLIKFKYNKKIDKECWKRYNAFIAKHKTVWGRVPNFKHILKIEKIDFSVDVEEIMMAYDKIFNNLSFDIKGYVVTTPFSMINDNEKFNAKKSTIFYSIYNLFGYLPSIVLAHEIFHIYFEKYTKRKAPNYEEAKEYFTVIMNDIFGKEVSKGYPNHQKVREKILGIWKKTRSMDECIKIL